MFLHQGIHSDRCAAFPCHRQVVLKILEPSARKQVFEGSPPVVDFRLFFAGVEEKVVQANSCLDFVPRDSKQKRCRASCPKCLQVFSSTL
jgi:hypothetical protein